MRPEGPCYWAGGNAALYFVNDNKFDRRFLVNCNVTTLAPRRVELEFEGRTIWTGNLQASQTVPLDVHITAKPGRNYLYFKTDHPPVVPENKQMVRLSFGLVHPLTIRADPPAWP